LSFKGFLEKEERDPDFFRALTSVFSEREIDRLLDNFKISVDQIEVRRRHIRKI
jgi:hypothetical protein